jgi:ubiquinone/menaquinone biosynthesis C-methylase UbiE
MSKISKKTKFWSDLQDSWIKNRDKPDNTEIPLISKIKSLCENKYTLDIGVGTGRYLHYFEESKKLYGIDFMEKFINTANKIKPNNCELFVDDVVNLKFNKYIDILFTMTCLQHIDPLQIDLAIKNLCELNAKDIVLWECTNKTYINNGFENSSDNYMFGHNYEELFEKYNYKLVYSELWSNNITYLLQFEQI